ncbi:hypothetical protein TRFO_29443 [Tritrichomonas foetus]|uniref:Uncharacterized protein n=1 Tax=Tritrichomonas foetus TaxID=1144522 RepID=A0A1J4JVU0_9EUKA|nr:hypothetical protein TRFO_29443 [Tritrichomonas foetus]|eukprot:OHT03247.1 hypothetical protein TRFO_29443 [Tritrichomonas foetus]
MRRIHEYAFIDQETTNKFLKHSAYLEGFQICQRDGKFSSNLRFYCKIGGRNKKIASNEHAHDICYFHFSFHRVEIEKISESQKEFLSKNSPTEEPKTVYIFNTNGSNCLDHNHTLDSRPFIRNILSIETKEQIYDFYKMEASIKFLQNYLFNVHDIEIERRDITKLISSMKHSVSVLETEQLKKYHLENGGFVAIKEKIYNENGTKKLQEKLFFQ